VDSNWTAVETRHTPSPTYKYSSGGREERELRQLTKAVRGCGFLQQRTKDGRLHLTSHDRCPEHRDRTPNAVGHLLDRHSRYLNLRASAEQSTFPFPHGPDDLPRISAGHPGMVSDHVEGRRRMACQPKYLVDYGGPRARKRMWGLTLTSSLDAIARCKRRMLNILYPPWKPILSWMRRRERRGCWDEYERYSYCTYLVRDRPCARSR
jgi:hypothetical protein